MTAKFSIRAHSQEQAESMASYLVNDLDLPSEPRPVEDWDCGYWDWTVESERERATKEAEWKRRREEISAQGMLSQSPAL